MEISTSGSGKQISPNGTIQDNGFAQNMIEKVNCASRVYCWRLKAVEEGTAEAFGSRNSLKPKICSLTKHDLVMGGYIRDGRCTSTTLRTASGTVEGLSTGGF